MNIPIDIRIDQNDWDLLVAQAEGYSTASESIREAIVQSRNPETFVEVLRRLILAPAPDGKGPTKNTMIRIPRDDIDVLSGYAARLGTTSNRIVQMLVKERVMRP